MQTRSHCARSSPSALTLVVTARSTTFSIRSRRDRNPCRAGAAHRAPTPCRSRPTCSSRGCWASGIPAGVPPVARVRCSPGPDRDTPGTADPMTRQPRQDEGRVGLHVCHSCRRCWAAAPRPDERDAVPQPMGRRVGIEPTTTGSTNRGSTAELTTPWRAGGQSQPGPLSTRRLSTAT